MIGNTMLRDVCCSLIVSTATQEFFKLLFPSSLWAQIEQSPRFPLLLRLNLELMMSRHLWSPQWRSWLCWPRLPPVPGLRTASRTQGPPAALWSKDLAGHQPCSTEPSSACPENLTCTKHIFFPNKYTPPLFSSCLRYLHFIVSARSMCTIIYYVVYWKFNWGTWDLKFLLDYKKKVAD